MTPLVLDRRTDRMIASETFPILREPQATAGAERITGPHLTRIFNRAAATSGLPASLISAVAYLESWGDANAESPGRPQRHHAILRSHGAHRRLRVIRTTRFKVTTERKLVKRKNAETGL